MENKVINQAEAEIVQVLAVAGLISRLELDTPTKKGMFLLGILTQMWEEGEGDGEEEKFIMEEVVKYFQSANADTDTEELKSCFKQGKVLVKRKIL
ncbi:hypothetical protein [Caldisericum sp.]|uniref:hypothetical protein n=1 Tax=Caldisericum sp. TaxID=2499687 RepID=UPI003D109DCB